MVTNAKTIKPLLLGGAAVVSLVIAATSVILLSYSPTLPAALVVMTIAVLAISPFPIVRTIMLVRALDRYATAAESYATRDSFTSLYNQITF
jgi:hypothetical protein